MNSCDLSKLSPREVLTQQAVNQLLIQTNCAWLSVNA